MEAFRWLVPLPVFNTGVTRYPGQAGSIPVRLRSLCARQSRVRAREADVLEAITPGHNNDRIAADRYLGVATVKSHLNSIFVKLGARDRAHAATIALGTSD